MGGFSQGWRPCLQHTGRNGLVQGPAWVFLHDPAATLMLWVPRRIKDPGKAYAWNWLATPRPVKPFGHAVSGADSLPAAAEGPGDTS